MEYVGTLLDLYSILPQARENFHNSMVIEIGHSYAYGRGTIGGESEGSNLGHGRACEGVVSKGRGMGRGEERLSRFG